MTATVTAMATAEERLRPHREHVAAVEADLDAARRARDEEVQACLRDQLPITKIALAAGLSRTAIYDIAGRLAP